MSQEDPGPWKSSHHTEGRPRGTHGPRQEVTGYLSFGPEVIGLQDICRGGVLAGEWVGEEEGWLG